MSETAQLTRLTHLETTFIDTYLVDVVLKPQSDHPPIRATRVIVELEHVPDEHGRREAKVHVAVTGERIIEDGHGGYTTTGSGRSRAFGLAEEPVRYNLCREAILASLAQHQLDVSDVSPFAFEAPWEEHRQSLDVGAVNLSGAVSRYLHIPEGEDVEDDRF